MRKNLAALYMNETRFQKMPEQHQMTPRKAPPINYVIGNQKSSRRNKIYLITLELRYVINHYDVRRGVCATSLSLKEKTVFCKNSRDIKSNLDSKQFRFTNNIITAEQKQQITEIYIHTNYSYKVNLLIRDNPILPISLSFDELNFNSKSTTFPETNNM